MTFSFFFSVYFILFCFYKYSFLKSVWSYMYKTGVGPLSVKRGEQKTILKRGPDPQQLVRLTMGSGIPCHYVVHVFGTKQE